jgi:hypothetical protein
MAQPVLGLVSYRWPGRVVGGQTLQQVRASSTGGASAKDQPSAGVQEGEEYPSTECPDRAFSGIHPETTGTCERPNPKAEAFPNRSRVVEKSSRLWPKRKRNRSDDRMRGADCLYPLEGD